MQLTEDQQTCLRQWIAEGATVADIQNRLRNECNLSLSYLDTRLLLADLNVTPQNKPEPAPAPVPAAAPSTPPPPAPAAPAAPSPLDPAAPPSKVRVSIDEIAPPNAMLSGEVVFSDGMRAQWFVDETGRLALNPEIQGYRPSQPDVMEFQRELQRLAQSQGL